MKKWMYLAVVAAALSGAGTAGVWAHGMAHDGPVAGAMTGPMAGAMTGPMAGSMATRMNQRLAELKTKLHLEPSQEAAWATYAEAMQVPTGATANAGAQWPDRTAMGKMTTPERIDQMQAWHKRMDDEMKKRGDATKNFYAVLSSDQKKVFDAETLRMMARTDHQRMPHPPR